MRFFKSTRPDAELVSEALKSIADPATGTPVTEAGRIDQLLVTKEGDVTITLYGAPQTLERDERLRYEVEQAVGALKGINSVRVMLTAHSETPAPSAGQQRVTKGADLAGKSTSKPAPAVTAKSGTLDIPGIKHIIAVASAKGGVGKSTLSLNLAIALRDQGLRVGIMDADVYGPSLPTMTGTVESHPGKGDGGKITPVEAFGMKLMSIGYISDVDAPMIWRGPIVMSAITQMLKDIHWGELDVLIIDTPPGTGDAQLTLAQRVSLSGAVIVSTPQEVALADVRRGVAMFRKTDVPVLGIVENMAYFEDPVSQNRTYLFGEGGARRMAETLDVPFLGEVPLLQAIREGGDAGKPAALSEGTSSAVYADIAQQVRAGLEGVSVPEGPEIVFE